MRPYGDRGCSRLRFFGLVEPYNPTAGGSRGGGRVVSHEDECPDEI